MSIPTAYDMWKASIYWSRLTELNKLRQWRAQIEQEQREEIVQMIEEVRKPFDRKHDSSRIETYDLIIEAINAKGG